MVSILELLYQELEWTNNSHETVADGHLFFLIKETSDVLEAIISEKIRKIRQNLKPVKKTSTK